MSTTLLAAMTPAGMTAAFVVEGAADRVIFETFVERVPVPALEAGQVVVWDNLSVHKSVRARELIEAAGCTVVFLPPYSPDFSPIEQAFSETQDVSPTGQLAHARGVVGGDRHGTQAHHHPGRAWLVSALWLSARWPITMNYGLTVVC